MEGEESKPVSVYFDFIIPWNRENFSPIFHNLPFLIFYFQQMAAMMKMPGGSRRKGGIAITNLICQKCGKEVLELVIYEDREKGIKLYLCRRCGENLDQEEEESNVGKREQSARRAG